jgi:hypothetical protein
VRRKRSWFHRRDEGGREWGVVGRMIKKEDSPRIVVGEGEGGDCHLETNGENLNLGRTVSPVRSVRDGHLAHWQHLRKAPSRFCLSVCLSAHNHPPPPTGWILAIFCAGKFALKSIGVFQFCYNSNKIKRKPKFAFWEYLALSPTPLTWAHWGCYGNQRGSGNNNSHTEDISAYWFFSNI